MMAEKPSILSFRHFLNLKWKNLISFKEKKKYIHNYNVMYIMREKYGKYDHRSLDVQE